MKIWANVIPFWNDDRSCKRLKILQTDIIEDYNYLH